MGATRVLVADPDPATLRTVSETLPLPDFEVIGLDDGQEVVKRAPAFKPDLFILELNLPKLNGVSVLKSLRMRSEFAFIPVIFLTEKKTVETRILGFRIGADEFMPKPIDPMELDLRVAIALKVREKTMRTLRPPPPQGKEWSTVLTGMRGSLDQLGLPCLMSLLEAERKTGVLVILLEDGRDKARLWLQQGRILRARRDQRTDLSNQELIFQLFSLSQGQFDFRPCAVDVPDEIQVPITHLILEGARRSDETHRREHPDLE